MRKGAIISPKLTLPAMNTLTSFTKRLPGFGLMLSLLTVSLLSSCSRPGLVNNSGTVSFFLGSLLRFGSRRIHHHSYPKQDWSFRKKVLWTASSFLFPLVV